MDFKQGIAQVKARSGKGRTPSVSFTKHKKPQFVLAIGDEGAILVYMEGATVVRRLFAPTPQPEHSKSILELMQQHADAPVTLLMDVIDQQYIRHTFPPVSVFSLDGLVKQRLSREFPPEDIKGAIRLGRETTGRRDWVYLLASLANTATLQQWLQLIMAQPNHFGGIYLMPSAATSYVAALAAAVPTKPEGPIIWRMLVSHNKISGFRVVMLRDGKLVFTRLAQSMGEALPAVYAGNIEQEIQNTLDYVRRLGFSDTDGLEVFIVAGAEVRDAIEGQRIKAHAVHLLSPYDVAEMFDLPQAALAADRFGDVVFAAAFARLPKPSLKLIPGSAERLNQLQQVRSALRYGSYALGALFLLLAGSELIGTFSALSAASNMEDQLKALGPERATLQRQVEALGVDANKQSDIVTFYSLVKPDEYTPVSVLEAVSGLRAPNVTLNDWNWEWPVTEIPAPGTPPPAPDAAVTPALRITAAGSMKGNFPDNETIIQAVERYKANFPPALRRYKIEVNPQLTEGGGSGKISVALPTADGESEQTVALTITMQGPLPDTANPAAPGGTP